MTKVGSTAKMIVIGRHKFSDKQRELLAKVGLTEVVEQIATVNEVAEVVQKAKEHGAVIVVQALPPHLLMQLVAAASRAGVDVLGFDIEPVAVVAAGEACPAEADVELTDPRSGNKRCSRTVRLTKVVRVEVVKETLAE